MNDIERLSNSQILRLLVGNKLQGKTIEEVFGMDEYELKYCGLTDKQVEKILIIKELNKRINYNSMCVCENITQTPEKIYNYLMAEIGFKDQENFCVIYLNAAGNIIKNEVLFKGSKTQSIVAVDEILRRAILLKAVAIIVSHNHPSGEPAPSQADIDITNKISYACKMMNIRLLDHIIIGSNHKYFSFKEHKII